MTTPYKKIFTAVFEAENKAGPEIKKYADDLNKAVDAQEDFKKKSSELVKVQEDLLASQGELANNSMAEVIAQTSASFGSITPEVQKYVKEIDGAKAAQEKMAESSKLLASAQQELKKQLAFDQGLKNSEVKLAADAEQAKKDAFTKGLNDFQAKLNKEEAMRDAFAKSSAKWAQEDAAAQNKSAEALKKVTAEQDKATKAKGATTAAAKAQTKAFAEQTKQTSNAGNAMAFLKRTIAGFAVLKFVQLLTGSTKGVANFADSLNDLSDRTGLTVKSLSTLREVFKFGDASEQDLVKVFKSINVVMAEAGKGSEEAVSKLNKLGLSLTDASGKAKTSEEIFLDFADVIASTTDPAERTEKALLLFGKAGIDLIPTLAMGSKGIGALRSEFKALGVEVDDSTTQIGANFNDELDKMGLAFQGAGTELGKSLLPALTFLFQTITEVIKAYSDFNGKTDEGTAKHNYFKAAIEKFLYTLSVGISTLATLADTVITIFNIGYTVVMGVAAAIASVIALLTNGPKGASQVWEKFWEDSFKRYDETVAMWKNDGLGKNIRDSLAKVKGASKPVEQEAARTAKAMRFAADAAEESADDIDDSLDEQAQSAEKAALRITASISKQVEAQQKLVDEAVNKAKAAVDNQKKVANEFDAIAKRIAKSNGPGFDKQFDALSNKFKAKADANKKRDELAQAQRDEAEAAAQAKKRAALEQSVEDAKRALSEVDSLINRSNVEQAEMALRKFDDYEKEASIKRQLAAIDEEERAANQAAQVSRQEAYAKQALIAQEIREITAQIQANKKEGVISEDEINQLRELSKVIEDSVDAGDGVLSKETAKQYINEISKVAKDAAAANAEIAKQDAEKAMEEPIRILQDLQKQLKELEMEVKLDSVKAEANKIYDTIQDKLLANPMYVEVREKFVGGGSSEDVYEVDGYATGGFVSGPGTPTSDSIPAWLSNGEFVMNAAAVRHFGVNFMQKLNARKIPAFATGGLVSNTTTNNNSSATLNLKMPGGNVNINSSTSQASLDAALRRAALRNRK